MDLIIISVAILSYFCPAQRMASGSSGRCILKPRRRGTVALEEAQADRGDDTMENLSFQLSEFLSTMLRDVWSTPGFRHATEQAKKIVGKDSDNIICEEDCEDIVFKKIAQWAEKDQGRHFYGERELLPQKRMWDLMRRDKIGLPKEHDFSYWCRRVADHSESCRTVRGRAVADSTATEHAEISASYRALAEDILTQDLTREQMEDPRYKLRKGKALTTKQRSTVSTILRKNLGTSTSLTSYSSMTFLHCWMHLSV